MSIPSRLLIFDDLHRVRRWSCFRSLDCGLIEIFVIVPVRCWFSFGDSFLLNVHRVDRWRRILSLLQTIDRCCEDYAQSGGHCQQGSELHIVEGYKKSLLDWKFVRVVYNNTASVRSSASPYSNEHSSALRNDFQSPLRARGIPRSEVDPCLTKMPPDRWLVGAVPPYCHNELALFAAVQCRSTFDWRPDLAVSTASAFFSLRPLLHPDTKI